MVQLTYCEGIFDWDHALENVAELKKIIDAEDFWTDAERAQQYSKAYSVLHRKITTIRQAELKLDSYLEISAMAEEATDDTLLLEVLHDLENLAKYLRTIEIECLLSGEADASSCFIDIHSGAGGTESDDWTAMLLRMYMRWSDKHRYKITIIDKLEGEEAGIKRITIKVEGENAYGWLRSESGVHRLVRISPFSNTGKRHTSFSSVWVYPVIDDTINIQINEADLRIDTYRASGAGGQHVNKTDSAVRITHLPTKIVVQSQNDRSQHRNKQECMSMLRAKLYELELQKREDALEKESSAKTTIGWGHQIRSYVLQPYQLVKDARTKTEISDANSVLDGDIDDFLYSNLEMQARGKGRHTLIRSSAYGNIAPTCAS